MRIPVFELFIFCSQFASVFTKQKGKKMSQKMRNVLKRIFDFSFMSDFKFLSYGRFCTQNLQKIDIF